MENDMREQFPTSQIRQLHASTSRNSRLDNLEEEKRGNPISVSSVNLAKYCSKANGE